MSPNENNFDFFFAHFFARDSNNSQKIDCYVQTGLYDEKFPAFFLLIVFELSRMDTSHDVKQRLHCIRIGLNTELTLQACFRTIALLFQRDRPDSAARFELGHKTLLHSTTTKRSITRIVGVSKRSLDENSVPHVTVKMFKFDFVFTQMFS